MPTTNRLMILARVLAFTERERKPHTVKLASKKSREMPSLPNAYPCASQVLIVCIAAGSMEASVSSLPEFARVIFLRAQVNETSKRVSAKPATHISSRLDPPTYLTVPLVPTQERANEWCGGSQDASVLRHLLPALDCAV